MKKEEKIKRIMRDFRLFAQNFIKIVDNNGELVPFVLNDQQREFIENMEKYNIILKSRQLGFSTLSLAYSLYNAIIKPNTSYLIVSYKQDSSLALFERLKTMNNYLPREKFNIFPATKRDNRNELLFENGSRILCVTSGHKDVGRGNTFQLILLSEFAFYQNQEKVILSAEQSLAKNEESKVIIETTANGMNYFQQLFSNAWKGESKYKAFFFPFYSSAVKEQFKHELQQAEEWYRSENHGQRMLVKDLIGEEKILYEKCKNLSFIMWRQWKLLDMSKQQFYQEYPSNPMEAFISSGNSVFDQGKILEKMNYLPKPIREIGELPNILAKYLNKSLFIYHLPKRGKYWGGVDTASGSGGDYSAVAIYDSEGEQVCSFFDNRIPVYEFAEVVNELGRYFGYAFLVVERNTYGLPMLERLRKQYEYLNLYKQRIFDQKGKKKAQIGFTTTQATKGILISDFKEQFERGLININCPETLQQMQIFQENDGKLSNSGGNNSHDDLVIANALAIQGIKTNKYYVEV